MRRVTVLVANEPRVFREAMASSIARLRRHVEVVAVPADQLEAAAAGVRPDVVVANRLPPSWAGPSVAWVALYPDDLPRVVLRVGGETRVVADLGLDALLAVVDRATVEALVRRTEPGGGVLRLSPRGVTRPHFGACTAGRT